ncbi:MAG: para-nitrobenzyl esterase [Verrucomicrobiales bacterium]|nr:para-nitrobenzyl esterase [Verrucomicrobiales bacterium]|tara:strand:+ start:2029 stop:2877 length:849 start_codon:yes stop_codon:yes gene_type:complete
MRALIVFLLSAGVCLSQNATKDIPYTKSAHKRQVLDVYSPRGAKNLPVVFWIHGGGWVTGDKSQVELKPKIFNERGYVFVSTNYRLRPDVEMEDLIGDVAKAMGWVYKNIRGHGGDPNRMFVMGHSAGAQLAALLCSDHSYIKAEGVPEGVLKGCVPVDGDTYDLPAIIASAELRLQLHQLPPRKFGHREKFGNDPKKHINFSAVTHIKEGKQIPPFLILYVRSHPYNSVQAQRLHNVLREAKVASTLGGFRNTDHNRLNDELGLPNDPATKALDKFLTPLK